MKIDTGRVIAYGGGSGVSALSSSAKASGVGLDITPSPGDIVTLLNAPIVQIGGVQVVTADIVSVAGVGLVIIRLTFDVWKYFDERKRRRIDEAE